MSIFIKKENISNYNRYKEAQTIQPGEDYYKNLVRDYERKEKRKRETFRKWRLKNLEKHRAYMKAYHRRGKVPPTFVKVNQNTLIAEEPPTPTFTRVIENTLLTFD